MDAIRAQLAAEHRVLDDLFGRLLHNGHVLSHHDLLLVWCELEHRLLSHMDVEEQFLLPLVEASHYRDVERARAEHVRLRELVCTLGAAIELNTAREPAIRELSQLLHAHAEREDRLLYRSACERASVIVQFRMASALRAAARCAHESALKILANRFDARGQVSPHLP
jgi:hypothetical protein